MAGETRSCTTTCAASNDVGRLGVLYSNKDYGCEWDYDWRNKRFQRQDNTKFAVNIVGLCDGVQSSRFAVARSA